MKLNNERKHNSLDPGFLVIDVTEELVEGVGLVKAGPSLSPQALHPITSQVRVNYTCISESSPYNIPSQGKAKREHLCSIANNNNNNNII